MGMCKALGWWWCFFLSCRAVGNCFVRWGWRGRGGGGGGAGTDISHLFVKHGTTVSRTGVSGP